MKKYIKILLFSSLIGFILAYFFYKDIKKEVQAISSGEEMVTLFQVGVFKDYDNALKLSKTYPSGAIYSDNDYYRVIISLCYNLDVKKKLENYFTSKEITYYLKEIRVSKKLIDDITTYETIVLKSDKPEIIDNINNSVLNLFLLN